MVLKQPLQIFNGFWGDHHHWMFFGGLTIATNGFLMVFDFATVAFNGFWWFWTISRTMRWFRWIVVVSTCTKILCRRDEVLEDDGDSELWRYYHLKWYICFCWSLNLATMVGGSPEDIVWRYIVLSLSCDFQNIVIAFFLRISHDI